jgi:hypothetical protein
MGENHPLVDRLRAAAGGHDPPPDGRVEALGSPPGRSDAVVAFTAHSVVATGLDPAEVLAHLDPLDLGAPVSAGFLSWLAGRLGTPAGVLDLVMVAPLPEAGEDLPGLVPRDDIVDHPRVERSSRYRTDLRCYSDPDGWGIVVLGRGLARRWELAIEVEPEHRGKGLGTALARAAPRAVSDGEPLFAQVSPGNVASIRAFLAAGYRPICSEVLFLKRDP